KFGFTYMDVSYRRIDCNNCAGSLSYSAAATGNPSVSGQTGIGYAAFLLGLPSGGSFNFGADIDFRYKYYAGYIQDDFKLSSKLTVNAGLRYDLSIPRREARLRNSNFNPTIPNPAAGGILGALEFASEDNPILVDTRKNAFAPRLGFAYRLNAKTVIRGGGSVMWDIIRKDTNADTGIQGFGGRLGLDLEQPVEGHPLHEEKRAERFPGFGRKPATATDKSGPGRQRQRDVQDA